MGISEIWEWLIEQLATLWELAVEGLANLFEFLSGIFSNLGEFSPYGLFFAILNVVVLWVFRSKLFAALDILPPVQKTFWVGVMFIGGFAAGYLIGKKVFE